MVNNIIINWYSDNKRDLPWRVSNNPYRIWVSEIIMQQTKISQGQAYYERFIHCFPTIFHLADASEDEVLLLWKGLGYYSRARNMHFTAKVIVEKYKGIFPDSYKEVLALKGIGKYTAAAILSLAFGKPYPVVDGNVKRVISRIYGMKIPIDSPSGEKEIYLKAEQLIQNQNPGVFNSAMMEFGALHCKAAKPLCLTCPLSYVCVAYNNNMVPVLPFKNKQIEKSIRYLNYIVIFTSDGENKKTYMLKRSGKDIWKGLYDFPCIETKEQLLSANNLMRQKDFFTIVENQSFHFIEMSVKYTHVLTHQIIQAAFYIFHTDNNLINNNIYKVISINELLLLPVSKLTDRFLQQYKSWF